MQLIKLTEEQWIFLDTVQQLDKDASCSFRNEYPNTTFKVLRLHTYSLLERDFLNCLRTDYINWKKKQ